LFNFGLSARICLSVLPRIFFGGETLVLFNTISSYSLLKPNPKVRLLIYCFIIPNQDSDVCKNFFGELLCVWAGCTVVWLFSCYIKSWDL